ncbi:hypothetical protein C8F01DRAFT_1258140 [Mycena amicta]|nr:hypothetical protein C8F01DRAFT_1258140 [Mycena amicta]
MSEPQKFTLTEPIVTAIFDDTARGEWGSWVGAIDPDVRWWIASDKKDPRYPSGVHNVASWMSEVGGQMQPCLDGQPLKMRLSALDIVGNKAIVEAVEEATQANAKPYDMRRTQPASVSGTPFSPATGKIVEIHEYVNTAHLRDVIEGNSK